MAVDKDRRVQSYVKPQTAALIRAAAAKESKSESAFMSELADRYFFEQLSQKDRDELRTFAKLNSEKHSY